MTLLPCPFCGSPGYLVGGSDTDGPYWQSSCTMCDVATHKQDTIELAADLWNRRHKEKE